MTWAGISAKKSDQRSLKSTAQSRPFRFLCARVLLLWYVQHYTYNGRVARPSFAWARPLTFFITNAMYEPSQTSNRPPSTMESTCSRAELYPSTKAQLGACLRQRSSATLKLMELHFTPEQEAQLAQIATKEGTDPERLVKDAALRLLEEDARFRAAVREGIAQADRGEFIEEKEMDARLEQMLRS